MQIEETNHITERDQREDQENNGEIISEIGDQWERWTAEMTTNIRRRIRMSRKKFTLFTEKH